LKKLSKNSNTPAVLSSQEALDSINQMSGKVANSVKISRTDVLSSIYNDSSVKKALRQDQSGKCAYCESVFQNVSYGQIDHYRPIVACSRAKVTKRFNPGYYWLAYDWDNLVLSCDVCNKAKSYYFPIRNQPSFAPSKSTIATEQPLLLNPYVTEPADHLEFNEHIIRAKNSSDIGANSIEYYDLNREALKEKRRERWDLYTQSLILKKILQVDPQNVQIKEALSLFPDFVNGEYSGMITLQKKP